MIDFNTPFSYLHLLWHGRPACAMEQFKKVRSPFTTKSAIAHFNS
ncbi:hypothetical protein QUB63_16025 [Microcoleus sp. ARI1-B5]